MSIVSSSGRVYIYFSWSRSLARTGDEGKSCTSTFVAAKTLPRYLSFRENFANGGVRWAVQNLDIYLLIRLILLEMRHYPVGGIVLRYHALYCIILIVLVLVISWRL